MQKKITAEEYAQLVKLVSPKVNFVKTAAGAFFIGGGICCLAEFFKFWFLSLGFTEQNASLFASLILIFLTALFTGLGLFHKLAKLGGAGTFIPITGFANAIVSPALEFKTEGFILGVCSKMFVIAGPVLVYGLVSAIVAGAVFQIGLWVGVFV